MLKNNKEPEPYLMGVYGFDPNDEGKRWRIGILIGVTMGVLLLVLSLVPWPL